MKEKEALIQLHHYIDGWKSNDLSMILSSLDENCVIIESHGPIYKGIGDVERWFEFWLAASSKINKWDLLSFCFCAKEQTAFAEWDFCCISGEVEYNLPGISVFKFSEQKISFIHEYRMTRPAYHWKGDKLDSD